MIDPTGAGLKAFLAEDPGGPVVMLDLLRFVPETGRARYAEYVAHFRETSRPYGAEVLFLGDGSTSLVAEQGQDWDAVVEAVLQATVPG